MSAHKIVVVESEKSPKVCSSNWREDVILKRKLQVLDRSERTVVNRIVVDQKILNRRFQTKLNRSKMSYARATSNVELQKRLRDETTFVLNTNVGHNDDDDETLQRIWDRGRRFYKRRLENDIFRKKKEIGTFTCIEDDEPKNESVKKNVNIADRPRTCVYLRPDTAVVIDKTLNSRRPLTSVSRRTRFNASDVNVVRPATATQRLQSAELEPESQRQDQSALSPGESEITIQITHGNVVVTEKDDDGNRSSSAHNVIGMLDSPPCTSTKECHVECSPKQTAMNNERKETDAQSEVNVENKEVSNGAISDQNEANPDGASESEIDNPKTSDPERNDRVSDSGNQTRKTNEVPEKERLAVDPKICQNGAESIPDEKTRSLTEKQTNGTTSTATENPLTKGNSLGNGGVNSTKARKTKTKGRPSTAGGFLRTMLDSTKTSSARAKSAKPTLARTKASNAGIGSMFEDDEFQISLLDFQRFVVYSANYEARVKSYAERINSLKAEKTRAMDYYTLKLQSQTEKCRKMLKMEAARDATEEDIKRETGNLSIKSLTLKTINLDFQLKPASYQNAEYR